MGNAGQSALPLHQIHFSSQGYDSGVRGDVVMFIGLSLLGRLCSSLIVLARLWRFGGGEDVCDNAGLHSVCLSLDFLSPVQETRLTSNSALARRQSATRWHIPSQLWLPARTQVEVSARLTQQYSTR